MGVLHARPGRNGNLSVGRVSVTGLPVWPPHAAWTALCLGYGVTFACWERLSVPAWPGLLAPPPSLACERSVPLGSEFSAGEVCGYQRIKRRPPALARCTVALRQPSVRHSALVRWKLDIETRY